MSKQSTGQHLKELRMRFFIVAIFFIFGACLAYAFQEQVIHAVLAPLHGQKLVYLNPAGGFNFIFLISIYAGLAMAIPVLIHQLYAFVRPALPTSAQKKSYTLIIGSFLLLVAGILFGYLVAVPSALTFLYGFADAYIDASLTAESYLNFIIAYTIGIGLVFQIPLILLLINSIKPLTPGGLMKSERWIILGSVIVAAVITPTPDPINQLIVAGPVIIVYQIGVIIILTSIHKKYRASKKLARKAIKAQRQKAAPHHAPTPIPQHTAPQLNTAMQAAVKQPAVAQQRKVTKPAYTHSVDGFIRTPRPAVQRVTIPVRQKPQAKPVDRVIPRVPSPTQRNFTIDGMYRPVYPTN